MVFIELVAPIVIILSTSRSLHDFVSYLSLCARKVVINISLALLRTRTKAKLIHIWTFIVIAKLTGALAAAQTVVDRVQV